MRGDEKGEKGGGEKRGWKRGERRTERIEEREEIREKGEERREQRRDQREETFEEREERGETTTTDLSFLIGVARGEYLCDARVTCLHSSSWILSGFWVVVRSELRGVRIQEGILVKGFGSSRVCV